MSQGTDMKIACFDDSVHLFVHRQCRVEDDIVHGRHTRITCVGRALGELLSCAKCDRLGLASIEQQSIDKEPATHCLNALEQPSDDRSVELVFISILIIADVEAVKYSCDVRHVARKHQRS